MPANHDDAVDALIRWRLSRELPSFDSSFGASFEDYVGEVLKSVTRPLKIVTGRQVKAASRGKSCDYIVEAESYVMLIECKACSFVSRLLTEQRFAEDGSTHKIAGAIEQLYTTAHGVRSGAFTPFGIDKSKPIFAVVATFGDIPFANSDWYFDSFFVPRFADKVVPPLYPSTQVASRPAVMSIGTLELLIMLINATGCSPLDLIEERSKKGYVTVGDWSPYLEDKLREVEADVRPLGSIQRATDEFFASLRIVRNASGTYDQQ